MLEKLSNFLNDYPSQHLTPMYKFLAACLYFIPAFQVSLIISLAISLLQTYLYIKQFDYNVLMEFSTPYLGILYVFTIHVICIWDVKRVEHIYQTIREWKTIHSNCSVNHPKMKQVLCSMTRKANVTVIIFLLLACVAVVLDSYYFCHDSLVTIFLIGSTESVFYNFILALLLLWDVPIIMITMAPPVYFIYTLFQSKVAIILLTDYILGLKKRYKNDKNRNWLKDEMEIIVTRHLEIKRFTSKLVSDQVLFYLYICVGVMIAVMSMFAYFSLVQRVALCAVNVMCFGFFLCTLCDTAEEYVQLNNLLENAIHNLDWYNWELTHQRSYLVILTYLNKPVNLSILLVDINRQFLKKESLFGIFRRQVNVCLMVLQMLKGLFPVLNYFYSTKK